MFTLFSPIEEPFYNKQFKTIFQERNGQVVVIDKFAFFTNLKSYPWDLEMSIVECFIKLFLFSNGNNNDSLAKVLIKRLKLQLSRGNDIIGNVNTCISIKPCMCSVHSNTSFSDLGHIVSFYPHTTQVQMNVWLLSGFNTIEAVCP